MKTYKLHLLRHGYTDANLNGVYCGSTDVPLCEQGERELYSLFDEATYPYAEAVYTSPLVRAKDTASILYPDCEQIVVEDLREASFGIYEGKLFSDLKNDEQFQKYISFGSDYVPEGAEPPEEFFSRCCSALVNIVKNMMTCSIHSAAVVTHAGVIFNMLAGLAYPKLSAYDWQCQPGCGFTVIADPVLFMREPVVEVMSEIPCFENSEAGEEPEN